MSDKIFGEPVHKPPTPRTDARAGRGHTFSSGAELVFADFARELERELAARVEPLPNNPMDGGRWRHVKRGTDYVVVAGSAELQSSQPLTEGADLIVYQGIDGKVWARPITEFADGRYERLWEPPYAEAAPVEGQTVMREALEKLEYAEALIGVENYEHQFDGARLKYIRQVADMLRVALRVPSEEAPS